MYPLENMEMVQKTVGREQWWIPISTFISSYGSQMGMLRSKIGPLIPSFFADRQVCHHLGFVQPITVAWWLQLRYDGWMVHWVFPLLSRNNKKRGIPIGIPRECSSYPTILKKHGSTAVSSGNYKDSKGPGA
jgi:hypothetical protein